MLAAHTSAWIGMNMNWLEKYCQEEVTPVVESENPEQGYNEVLFDGNAVNDIVAERVIAPLNSYDPLVYEFLETIPSDSIARFLVNISSDGMLPQFKRAVESYVSEGYAEAIVPGVEESISAIQNWFEVFKASGGDRTPFDTLEKEIRTIVGV